MKQHSKHTQKLHIKAIQGALDFEYYLEYMAHNFKQIPAYVIEAGRRQAQANEELLTTLNFIVKHGIEPTKAQILEDLSRRSIEPTTKQHR